MLRQNARWLAWGPSGLSGSLGWRSSTGSLEDLTKLEGVRGTRRVLWYPSCPAHILSMASRQIGSMEMHPLCPASWTSSAVCPPHLDRLLRRNQRPWLRCLGPEISQFEPCMMLSSIWLLDWALRRASNKAAWLASAIFARFEELFFFFFFSLFFSFSLFLFFSFRLSFWLSFWFSVSQSQHIICCRDCRVWEWKLNESGTSGLIKCTSSTWVLTWLGKWHKDGPHGGMRKAEDIRYPTPTDGLIDLSLVKRMPRRRQGDAKDMNAKNTLHTYHLPMMEGLTRLLYYYEIQISKSG